jgi:molybdate transport system ATP-binding protein
VDQRAADAQEENMTPGIQASFTKRFAGGPVIRAENLRTGRNGVTVLFGPSGSGKTTMLRCLAGLEDPEEGTIQFDGEVWFDSGIKGIVPPQKRNIGFVPQDHALFPHLSVATNIGYGLHGQGAAEKKSRVGEIVRWLGLDGLETRLPSELSSGQQQRVALARAVARKPRLLLLDEPLSALDTPTRQRLRGELRSQLVQSGIPTIVVTHDRLEAMALGDQLVVVDQGRMLQTGPVADVFNHPADLAAAAIVGTETVLLGRVIRVSDGLATVTVNGLELTALAEDLDSGASAVHLCIRAEDVILLRNGGAQASARNRLSATVLALAPEGPMIRIELDCGFPLKALLTRQACAELALKPGASMVALIKAPHIHLIPFSH